MRSELYAWLWVILLSCSLMGLAIALSLSRGGILTLIATLVFISLLLIVNRKGHRRKRLSGAAAWILLLTILSLAAWVGIDALLPRIGGVDSDLDERATLFRDSWKLVAENPALGVGPGMYQWRFRPYQSENPKILFTYAHNDYLQSAAEWGIPAALFFWSFVLWRFYRSIRMFFQSHQTRRQGIALGCSAAILAILLHSFIDFNLQIPSHLMIFCTIVGLSWSLDLQERRVPVDSERKVVT